MREIRDPTGTRLASMSDSLMRIRIFAPIQMCRGLALQRLCQPPLLRLDPQCAVIQLSSRVARLVVARTDLLVAEESTAGR